MSLDSKKLGKMPNWDLRDLYTSHDPKGFKGDLQLARDKIKELGKYKGKIAKLSAQKLVQAIKEYEEIQTLTGKIGSFAFLYQVTDIDDTIKTVFKQNTLETLNDLSSELLFFTLEMNKIENQELEKKLNSMEIAHYKPWIENVRKFKKHQLADEIEDVLRKKSVTAKSSWVRMFDETMARLKFNMDGKEVTSAEILDFMSSTNRKERIKAGEEFARVLGENIHTFALITNVLAKDKSISDDLRKFAKPISSCNLGNNIEDEVVDSLIEAVKSSYKDTSHRYYTMKAKWLGLDKMHYTDRNAPIPGEDEKIYSWDEAVEIILSAYKEFSPKMAEMGKMFFDNNWVDAPVKKGKRDGAFAHPTVTTAHPYLLVNYQGKIRDVMTLAHELGHGVHQMLAREQGELLSSTPLTLAETASVFGEQLTFQALLKAETDPIRKKHMLASKTEDMLNTLVRQVAFCEFEKQVHDLRSKGEIPESRLCDIWMNIQKESLGDIFNFEDEYKYFWSYIPHFIHHPFYVYAYAFGDCLVNALYTTYQQSPAGFEDKYLQMLKFGGRLHHKELLAPFGLDASKKDFWMLGINVLKSFIDELETIDSKVEV